MKQSSRGESSSSSKGRLQGVVCDYKVPGAVNHSSEEFDLGGTGVAQRNTSNVNVLRSGDSSCVYSGFAACDLGSLLMELAPVILHLEFELHGRTGLATLGCGT